MWISSEKRAFPVKHVYFQQIFGSFVKLIFFGENQQFVCNGICDFWSLEYKCTKSSWTMVFCLETFCHYLKKKHGKSLEDFVYIVWIRLIWAILLGNFLDVNITKLKQKTSVHEQSGLNITTWWQGEEAVNPTKLFGGKTAQYCHIWRGKKYKSPDLDHSFKHDTRI